MVKEREFENIDELVKFVKKGEDVKDMGLITSIDGIDFNYNDGSDERMVWVYGHLNFRNPLSSKEIEYTLRNNLRLNKESMPLKDEDFFKEGYAMRFRFFEPQETVKGKKFLILQYYFGSYNQKSFLTKMMDLRGFHVDLGINCIPDGMEEDSQIIKGILNKFRERCWKGYILNFSNLKEVSYLLEEGMLKLENRQIDNLIEVYPSTLEIRGINEVIGITFEKIGEILEYFTNKINQ